MELLETILQTAREDDRIRGVVLEGSRTNPHAPRDIFQDYDVLYIVRETESFQADKGWIDRFGERLYMQYPEDHPLYPADKHSCYGWLIQLRSGDRLDLHVCTPEYAKTHDLTDSLTRVLLDKDGVLEDYGPGNDSTHWVQKPGEPLFAAECNEFWWCLNNLCKGLWRGELSYAQWVMNDLLRPQLLKMLAWKAAIPYDFRISVGKCGKYLHRFLPEQVWEGYLSTYCGADLEEMWAAGETLCALFHQSAQKVAAELDYAYDTAEAESSWGFFRHVRAMPADAKTIF